MSFYIKPENLFRNANARTVHCGVGVDTTRCGRRLAGSYYSLVNNVDVKRGELVPTPRCKRCFPQPFRHQPTIEYRVAFAKPTVIIRGDIISVQMGEGVPLTPEQAFACLDRDGRARLKREIDEQLAEQAVQRKREESLLLHLQAALEDANATKYASQDDVFGKIWDAIELIDPGRCEHYAETSEWREADDR